MYNSHSILNHLARDYNKSPLLHKEKRIR